MLCYSVDSKDSLENVESKWVGEIADNCPNVKLVLVALKCDLRETGDDDDGDGDDDANAAAAANGPSAAEVREWARANGWDVPDRGRVAADVRSAYDAAH